MKIVIVGGGSYGWTPTIVRDIAVTEGLSGTLVLEDIDPEPLEVTVPLARKIVEAAGADLKVEGTTNQREALTGADYVVLTITTGGLETMEVDLEVPKKYGIYQPVGDTVGPGGLSRALRNLPVVVDIAREMEEVAPGAWLLNYTNPMTTICRAVTRETSVPTIGLCHELFGTLHLVQCIFGLEDWRRDVTVRAAGINHLCWILEMSVLGYDGLDLLSAWLEDPDKLEGLPGITPSRDPVHRRRHAVKFELFKIFGALPAAGDRHVCEFFPHFLTERRRWAADYGVELTLIEHRRQWREAAIQNCKDLLAGRKEIDLSRSDETASRIMLALAGGPSMVDVGNLPNEGQVANLPLGAVVESMAVMDATGCHGIAVGDLPAGVAAVVHRHVMNQEIIVEASLTGDRELALEALVNDPLVGDLEDARAMLDEMLEANRKWLPQFFE